MAKLTLSSESTNFTEDLTPPIRLESDKEYEAAFISLHTYNTLPNLTEINNKFKYSIDKGKTWKIITFSKGAYEFDEINAVIQREMKENGDYDKINEKYYIGMEYYKPTSKTILDISNENCMVDFGIENSIGSTLGFPHENQCLSNGIHQSPNIIDIETVNSIQVHCNIVDGSYLNSNGSNVIHSFTPKVSPGFKVIEHPNPELIFLPVNNRFTIQSIKIWLTDQDNNPIDLMGEKITVVLLIREKFTIKNLLTLLK